MKAILIDSTNRTVTSIEIDDWRGIAPAIGNGCDLFTTANPRGADWNRNTLYVDDEGLLRGPDSFFIVKGYPAPLAGNGVILGLNPRDGDSRDTSLTVEQVRGMVKFLTPFEAVLVARAAGV